MQVLDDGSHVQLAPEGRFHGTVAQLSTGGRRGTGGTGGARRATSASSVGSGQPLVAALGSTFLAFPAKGEGR